MDKRVFVTCQINGFHSNVVFGLIVWTLFSWQCVCIFPSLLASVKVGKQMAAYLSVALTCQSDCLLMPWRLSAQSKASSSRHVLVIKSVCCCVITWSRLHLIPWQWRPLLVKCWYYNNNTAWNHTGYTEKENNSWSRTPMFIHDIWPTRARAHNS